MFLNVFLLLIVVFIAYTNGRELTADSFEKDVVRSQEIWLVEFYSPMCGSCSEFAPNWDKLENSMKSSISLGKINIDKKENMKLAEELGVLDEGLPNIRLFAKHEVVKGKSIPIDDNVSTQYKKIVDAVKKGIYGANTDENGVYLKTRAEFF